MRKILFFLACLIYLPAWSQTPEKIEIPEGVVYQYCDPAVLQKALDLVKKELTGTPTYELCSPVMFVGPVLWDRYKKVKSLKKIPGGNVTLLVDEKQLSAKMTQEKEDCKKVWDELRRELAGKEFKLRKATPNELRYYWSVINFDIEEPLIIIETAEHRYLVNLIPKTLKLIWVDEIP